MNFFERIGLAWKFVWFGGDKQNKKSREYTELEMEIFNALMNPHLPKRQWCDECGDREYRWDFEGKKICNTCHDKHLGLD